MIHLSVLKCLRVKPPTLNVQLKKIAVYEVVV